MASIINLTPQQPIVVQISGAGVLAAQPLFTAIDISGYDLLGLELGAAATNLSVSAKIGIATGMTIDTDDGWLNLDATNAALSFADVTSGSSAQLTYQVKSFGCIVPGSNAASPLLRHIRWVVSGSSSGTGYVTFSMRGMARRLGGV